jgi:hypothetical protein
MRVLVAVYGSGLSGAPVLRANLYKARSRNHFAGYLGARGAHALQLLFLSATLAVVGCHLWRRGAKAHPAEPDKVAV